VNAGGKTQFHRQDPNEVHARALDADGARPAQDEASQAWNMSVNLSRAQPTKRRLDPAIQ
jgi:hypothetical protein